MELWDTWYFAVESVVLNELQLEKSTTYLWEALGKVNDGVIELRDRGDGSCFLSG